MSPSIGRALLAVGVAATSLGAVRAQDEKATPPVAVSGMYSLDRVAPRPTSVSMDFSATIFNPGDIDVTGEVVLRDPAVANRIWSQFGRQTIRARGSLRVSDVVSVPREIYDSWSTGDAPGLFVNIENDRGSVALHRVLLSRAPGRPGP